MKTASIEFITFDAQDVIATSTAYFTLSGNLKSDWTYIPDAGLTCVEFFESNDDYEWYLEFPQTPVTGGHYKLTKDGTTYSNELGSPLEGDKLVDFFLYGVTQVGSIPVGATTLDTFEAIFGWVMENCDPAK